MKILLVDDDLSILRVVKMQLARMGHEVMDFDNPVLAVEAVSSFQPDLVISDLQMPVLDGIGVARQVAEQAKGEAPLVLIMSGHHLAEAELASVSPSLVVGLLQKPFIPPRLSQVLSLLEQARRQCPGTLEPFCSLIPDPAEGQDDRGYPTKLCGDSEYAQCPLYEKSCGENLRAWIKLQVENPIACEREYHR